MAALAPPHLEASVFDRAALYDAEYRSWRKDVGFYRRAAQDLLGQPAEILELACGTGRVSRALVRDGHHVFGFDTSAPMLRRAAANAAVIPRAHRSRLHYFRADMRRFAVSRRFPLIICPFNSLEHLYDHRDLEACLAAVHRHLARDGVFLFDVHNPSVRILGYSEKKVWGRKTFRDDRGAWLKRSLCSRYDEVSQVHHVRATYQPVADDKKTPTAAPFVLQISQRQFFPAELEALLAANSFRVVLRLGEFDGRDFAPGAPSQIVYCQPRN